MSAFLDPLGLIAGTWNFLNAHGGGGFAALLGVLVVVVAHLVVVAGAVGMLLHPIRVVEAVRGFAAGVQQDTRESV